MTSMCEIAVAYAQAGWPVHPCREVNNRVNPKTGELEGGKSPYLWQVNGKGGHLLATTDPAQIAKWWDKWPYALIGVALPENVLVIDLDTDDARERLEEHTGTLPGTLTARTGREGGGTHLYYVAKTSDLIQSVGIIPDVDLRLHPKGYVIAPPSVHPDTGTPYTWVNPGTPIAMLPEHAQAALYGLQHKPRKPRSRVPRPEPLTSSQLHALNDKRARGIVTTMQDAPIGERNTILNWAAYTLCTIGKSDTLPELEQAAALTGLDEREIESTIRSAKAGANKNGGAQ